MIFQESNYFSNILMKIIEKDLFTSSSVPLSFNFPSMMTVGFVIFFLQISTIPRDESEMGDKLTSDTYVIKIDHWPT